MPPIFKKPNMVFMNEQVIYEDENLVAFNKPAGVNFDWILEMKPSLIPVHRLDKDTSGIILFSKNQKTADYLKSLFSAHGGPASGGQIKKTYLALVVGDIKNTRGVIDLPIGRSKKTPLKRVAIGEQRGKIREAVTEYKVLKRCGEYVLVEAYPKTGRTHQIRSHFAAVGHPVVCDKLYAGKKFICPANLTRHFLHAAAIEFTLPHGGRIKLEADLPEDLQNAIFALCHR